jgi:hypothetical protein
VIVAVAVLVVGRRTLPTPRGGLFLGGAIGAGYAAFAALTAVLRAIDAFAGTSLPAGTPAPALVESMVTVQQALLAPVTHPVWGALIGAAVFAGRPSAIAAAVGTALAHLAVDVTAAVSSGLLGTSAAAFVVQLLACGAVAAPAALVWRHRSLRLRHLAPQDRVDDGAHPGAADQRGGA